MSFFQPPCSYSLLHQNEKFTITLLSIAIEVRFPSSTLHFHILVLVHFSAWFFWLPITKNANSHKIFWHLSPNVWVQEHKNLQAGQVNHRQHKEGYDVPVQLTWRLKMDRCLCWLLGKGSSLPLIGIVCYWKLTPIHK